MPQAQEFRVRAVKVEYLSTSTKATAAVENLYQLLFDGVLQLTIQNKPPSYQRTLFEAMGIPLAFHTVPSVAGDSEGIMSLGRFVGIDPLNRFILLAALTPWTMKVSFNGTIPAALIGDRIRVSLAGMLRRLV
jgi:hypothetical protein